MSVTRRSSRSFVRNAVALLSKLAATWSASAGRSRYLALSWAVRRAVTRSTSTILKFGKLSRTSS